MRAGALWRRSVRAAIRNACVLGAEVHVNEEWHLLDSRFTIRAVGNLRELAPLVELLKAAQAREAKEAR
ncbi:hypothetical protein [Actinomadura rubrisoli]|uniref:Uncharacterized protein n=1 Tax=Actinomadura rubrisoli TaxID=2530368 RepID=A0A4R5CF32_9ACTN|nr:hypothetical protein [Actinomadura rubrisoli]TDD97609.1 hypothetical protein E1298_00840 [Actinomadura rubrisoli]